LKTKPDIEQVPELFPFCVSLIPISRLLNFQTFQTKKRGFSKTRGNLGFQGKAFS
jgi:hypothetical protein